MAEGTRVIEVVPYDPAWKTEFEKIKAKIDSCIGDLILTIEHVGSTSVEGLCAKPIIDLDVVMDSYDLLPSIIERLEEAGYEYQGNLGVEGREAFNRTFDDGFMKYHLYVCPKDGKGYLEHIAFRDYLRGHPADRDAYSALKLHLASQFRHDIDQYCDHKTEFVTAILNKTIYRHEASRHQIHLSNGEIWNGQDFPALFYPVDWGPVQAVFKLTDQVTEEALVSNVSIVPCIGDNYVVIQAANGMWELPGGTLEPGEHYRNALRREVMEELGGELLSYQVFGQFYCESSAEQPFRAHIPHPRFIRVAGYGEVRLVRPPLTPDHGEQIAVVKVVDITEAVGILEAAGRYDIAELYRLAHIIRYQSSSMTLPSTEIFDIFNTNMQKIGTASRQEAHAQGLWHQTFHCWIIHTSSTGDLSLLFQLRQKDKDTFPNLLDISCAGHLSTNENAEDGIRELQEELGIDVAYNELFSCGVVAEENIISQELVDREFCHVFLYECNQPLHAYKFQLSEISGLFLIDLNDFKQLISGGRDSVLAKGVVMDELQEKIHEDTREVVLTDIVPHDPKYYDLIFQQIHSLINHG
ncbi:GrpB family protein [Paenibacillus eucommiae]|uniref:GrpB-like predicted nucleotidyltransferase (UPF0157 family)/8-oxo-dGTP pyrophosphatase MutT (NUDIX family) n=1 Tax=Paenibacillus eucommiae TaxID=1355755 RepID=A0ABS4ISP6_9BACL|nr:GrpB family protein [Paenibacillus eucommiae]MBP1990600.1 GrpB-like predicted nucleotidyltransferase (UPF0157 family)/8-oxo-dGTP pyrophosphatase MutT (NUDIX family) [Paenibacillus eucommiae]